MAWKVIDLQWYLRQELEDTAVLFCNTVAWRKPLLKQKHWLSLVMRSLLMHSAGVKFALFLQNCLLFLQKQFGHCTILQVVLWLRQWVREGRAGHSMFLVAASSFIFCLGLGFSLFFQGRSQAGLENLWKFSYMVYNGTMGGINTLMIMSRNSAKIILGGRIREGRWEDFPNTLKLFVQLVYQKNSVNWSRLQRWENIKVPKSMTNLLLLSAGFEFHLPCMEQEYKSSCVF